MKLLNLFLFLFINILLSAESSKDLEQSEKMKRFLTSVTETLSEKHHLSPTVTGGAFNNGYQELDIGFDREGNLLTVENARVIIVDCVDTFLNMINTNYSLIPHLRDYPYTAKNVSCHIFNYTENKNDVPLPYIFLVDMSKGAIEYGTHNPDEKYGTILIKSETYEEAKAILKAQ